MDKHNKLRRILFFLFTIAIGILLFFPLKALLYSEARGMYYEYYSHILLIPLVSAYLFYLRRREIGAEKTPAPAAGILVGVIGIIGYGLGWSQAQNLDFINATALQIAGLLLTWLGTFLFFRGKSAFRQALFPLFFLFFMVPVPKGLMDIFIYVLQTGSTWATAMIFSLLRVPYFQEGFVFEMGKVAIEVARECSGIRSTMALVITGVLAAYLFLEQNGKRLILMLTILPITVLKNGIRIVTLTLLAIHVDESFLTGGFLHKSGGFLFFIPALIIFGAVLLWLRRLEKKKEKRQQGE